MHPHHGGMMPGFGMGMMGFPLIAGAAGLGLAFVTLAALSVFCRSCGTRTVVVRDDFNGKCPKCGNGIYRRDIKRTTLRQRLPDSQQPVPANPDDPIQILKSRLAKGELTPEDYQARLKLVQG